MVDDLFWRSGRVRGKGVEVCGWWQFDLMEEKQAFCWFDAALGFGVVWIALDGLTGGSSGRIMVHMVYGLWFKLLACRRHRFFSHSVIIKSGPRALNKKACYWFGKFWICSLILSCLLYLGNTCILLLWGQHISFGWRPMSTMCLPSWG